MKTKIALLTTVPETTFYALEDQIPFLVRNGFDVVSFISRGKWITYKDVQKKFSIPVFPVNFTRVVSPGKDLLALIHLIWLFVLHKPDIVHVSTPKASFIGLLASFIIRIPIRIYTIRGIPYCVRNKGFRAWIFIDKINCLLATHVIAVSKSNKNYLVKYKINSGKNIHLLGHGSSHGVNATSRYNPSLVTNTQRTKFRKKIDIHEHMCVFGFVGRMVRDKGIEELAKAWQLLLRDRNDCCLLLIGPHSEPRNRISSECYSFLHTEPSVKLLKESKDPLLYYAIMDIFVFPSHREGFPNVVLEASAMELPVITTTALGCIDSIEHDKTGIIIDCGDHTQLFKAMKHLFDNTQYRYSLGKAGRKNVLQNYSPENICTEHLTLYRKR